MKNFAVYKTTTGEILRTGTCPDDMLAIQAGIDETVIEGIANDSTQYIFAGSIVDKPAMNCSADKTILLANGIDVAVISGLPNPTKAQINGPITSNTVVIDSTLELTFDLPGVYKVTLTSLNKLPQEFILNAT